MPEKKQVFEVIVVGGGPAGLMAAGQAASSGADTLLLEKMDQPGRKLRISGQGRCNLTNEADREEFIRHFGSNGQFLRQAFHRFFNKELAAFFEHIGVPTKVERGGRVFPSSGNAETVAEKLANWAAEQGTMIQTSSPVEGLQLKDARVIGVRTRDGETLACRTAILATGGASFTGTGSTGDGCRIARKLGHTIVPLRPALVPIKTRGNTAERLQGLTLKNVSVSVFQDGHKTEEAFGEMMFTHFGVSGPIILTMSGRLVDALREGKKIELSIDLKPALDETKLEDRLLRELDRYGKMQYQNILKRLLPKSLIPVCADQTGIAPEKPGHQVASEERGRLKKWLKDFRLEVSGYLPLEAAMVTQGGISLDEVDPRSMESLLVKGLFFAGEVLDLAANTGGYNLQAAFSTGWLAGQTASASNQKK